MDKGKAQVSGFGGKLLKKRNIVLASAMASVLGLGTVYAAATGVEIATQKSTISNKTDKANAGTVLKLWFKDASGNMTTTAYDYTVKVESTNDAVIADFSFPMAAGEHSTTLTVGGVAPAVSVAGIGSTKLMATATATTAGTMKSSEIPLTVVEKYLSASFTPSLSNDTSIGEFVNITLKDNAGASVSAAATVTHVAGGIGSKPVEVVPAAMIGNTNGNLMFSFEEPTGTVSTVGGEYYIVSSAGMGDALIAGDGDVKADIVIPTMPALKGKANITGGVSKQDNVFAPLFPATSAVTSVSETDALNINIAIKPDTAHVGKEVKKIIIAAYVDIYDVVAGLGSDTILAWTLSSDGVAFTSWDWQSGAAPGSYQTKTLNGDTEAFHILSGPLTGYEGMFFFFAGYQLPDNTTIFNDTEIGQLLVTPAP